MSIQNPYATCRVRTGEYSVVFRYMIGKTLKFKHVCGNASEHDAKKIAKMYNEDWSKKHDKA